MPRVHYAPSEADRERALDRAGDLLEEHKAKVWAVGRALAERRRLTGAEVRELLMATAV